MNSRNGLRRPMYLVPVLRVAIVALIVGAAPWTAWVQDEACSSRRGAAIQLPTTKLFIEHNATDEDIGVHGTPLQPFRGPPRRRTNKGARA
jgi:hypothetical protein